MPHDTPGFTTIRRPRTRTSKSIKRMAREYLSTIGLFERVVRDTQVAFGIHGEDDLIRMLYLALTSRRLPDPISVIVQGEPGSGKTYAIDSMCEYVPPDELWTATHVSPRALYYDREGVKHKVINGKERSRIIGPEAQEHSSAIRQLISDKQIVNRTVSSERAGDVQTVEGPVCYLESTTFNEDKIFDEDLSRCLLLRTTSDPVHRREVLLAIGKRHEEQAANQSSREDTIALHRCIQGEILQPSAITIPYSGQLAHQFPVETNSATRLFERLLYTIRACAHLHQYQRERTGSGVIAATVKDYEMVKPMLDRCVADATQRALKGTKARVYAAVRAAGETARPALVKQLVIGDGKSGRTQVHEAVSSLVAQGLLVELKTRGGKKPARLRCFQLPTLE